jgi:transposase-like protein
MELAMTDAKKPSRRKFYSDEIKQQVLAAVTAGEKQTAVSERFKIPYITVNTWVNHAKTGNKAASGGLADARKVVQGLLAAGLSRDEVIHLLFG